MTDKEMKKLSRADLLEMLLAQRKENEALRTELDAARAALDDRRIALEKSGSIAEASLQLNGVFEAAQAACEQYTENIRMRSAQQEEFCARMEQETREKCDRMLAEAQQQSEAYWNEVNGKVKALTDSFAGLRQLLENLPQAGQS